MMKGALFDLDGVLADTASLHFKAWRKLAKENFGRSLPDELENKTRGISRSDSLSVILDYLEITVSKAKFHRLAEEKNQIYRSFLTDLSPDEVLPGMRDFITDLRKKGILTALASATKTVRSSLKGRDFQNVSMQLSILRRLKQENLHLTSTLQQLLPSSFPRRSASVLKTPFPASSLSRLPELFPSASEAIMKSDRRT